MKIDEYIHFEDDYLLVVNKPSGLMVEPDRNGHTNLLGLVRKYLGAKNENDTSVYVQHLHRLDRPVSGLVLFTKNRSILNLLSEQFAQRKVKKTYLALSANGPIMKEGKLENWIRKEKKKAVLVDEYALGATFASLSYLVEQIKSGLYRWEINLHTGKYHQIRFQLANIDCPILGDHQYGSSIQVEENKIYLHANLLEIEHPISKEKITFTNRPSWDIGKGKELNM